MRITIDYTAAARQGAGIGRYTRELISAVLAQPTEHTFTLMAGVAQLGKHWQEEKARLKSLAHNPDHLIFRDIPLTDEWLARLWQRARLPIPAEWLTGETDIFYSPDFVLPPLLRETKGLLTVHDLSFIRHPETFPEVLQRYLEKAVPRSIERANHILADSEATRQDLISLLEISPEKITTLHSGVSKRFTSEAVPQERQMLQEKYNIGKTPYILAVGTIQPRKNYMRLMEACDPLSKIYTLELVIVGQPAWMAAPIEGAAQQRPYVRMLGFVDDVDLPALYRQATVLAFPSLYEGFGLPVLEAMASGTPVVGASVSSIPEVIGDAGILVDPMDIVAWSSAIQEVLENKDLRAGLRQKGLAQAAAFTWERTAGQWLDCLQLAK
ncbi:MAG: glycosyltransferase family 4 protein [Anaerolineae bacterium]|nr:glycosyltransferase family 4 protein [Anaerolineae bacterium]